MLTPPSVAPMDAARQPHLTTKVTKCWRFSSLNFIRCHHDDCLSLWCWIAKLLVLGVNDRQKGHTDEYTGESVLGTCFLFDLGKPSAIEVIRIFMLEIFLWIVTTKLLRCAKMGMTPGSLSLLRLNILSPSSVKIKWSMDLAYQTPLGPILWRDGIIWAPLDV